MDPILAEDLWTPARVAAVTGGRWISEPPAPSLRIAGFGIDGRTLRPGEVFVAIRGERFDGHDFLPQAQAAGAALGLVEQDPGTGHPALPLLSVPSTVAALQTLARHHRGLLGAGGCRVVSVSGSNGKTTTRHLIHQILTRAGLAGSQSPKSFNNHLGVPLTVLAGHPGDDFLVCEIGTNHPGEIAVLGGLVRPDIAVIASIGEEHLEFFGDLAGVLQEEAAILCAVTPGGTALVPAGRHLPFAVDWGAAAGGHRSDLHVVRFDLDPLTEGLPLPGAHNRLNASAAAGVARLLGIGDAVIAEALSCATGAPMRGEILFAGDPARPTLINDAYNANPDSMRAALAMLQEHRGRTVAILGDMLELGERAAAAHRSIAAIALAEVASCVFVGPAFSGALAELDESLPAPAAVHAELDPYASEAVAALLRPGDLVLLKGSRAMGMERLVEVIERRSGDR